MCGGQAVTVAAGATTAGIGARLASPPFPQTGHVSPLSGKAIRVVPEPDDLFDRLPHRADRLPGNRPPAAGRRAGGPTIASVRVVVMPGTVGRLVFRLPAAFVARLRRAPHRSLAALVEITTPPSHTITRFALVRPLAPAPGSGVRVGGRA